VKALCQCFRTVGFLTLLTFQSFGAGQGAAQPNPDTGLYRYEACTYGVYRQTPRGISQSESIERMQDLELSAAAGQRGVWAYTDWDALPEERLAERMELEELRVAMRSGPKITAENPININEATAASLEQLPGIGPTLAARIIEQRKRQPFLDIADLQKVSGIGSKTYEALEPLVVVAGDDD
jgi:competence protein ComEA